MEAQKKNDIEHGQPSCNVNSKFNFMMGGIAIAAAVVIGYLVYLFVGK